VVLALTAVLSVGSAGSQAHALNPWCGAAIIAGPFADIECEVALKGTSAATTVISFADDPLGYLQQHLSAGADTLTKSLLSETSKP
jgi:hypothetical protein